jgi:hypothetical protein
MVAYASINDRVSLGLRSGLAPDLAVLAAISGSPATSDGHHSDAVGKAGR